MSRAISTDQRDVRIGVLWPGNPAEPVRVTPDECRLHRVFDALADCSVTAVPVVYADEVAEQVHEQLFRLDGVLVWVNPIEKGRDRSVLDDVLRQVAAAGVFVSAHPDIVLKMGTKQVLYDTRDLGWGCDTHLYRTADELREQLPLRLRNGKARVLKQLRANGGNGVWKVELAASARGPGLDMPIRVRHALRGSIEEVKPLQEFLEQCNTYFTGRGRMIDQPYQKRLPEGMIRCYLVRDKVAGFGDQAINALFPAPAVAPSREAPPPGPRLYHPPTKPEFQSLKRLLEDEWVREMQRVLGIETASLPVIWDADFLLGPKTEHGDDTYVLCEINVSSVFPFPDSALIPLAEAAAAAASRAGANRRLL